MTTAETFHQTEDPVFLEPEFYTQLMGGYDTSHVFSRDFLEPHTIPSLPAWQPHVPTDSSPHAERVERPKSPSGATYHPGGLPRELEDYLIARALIAPPYERHFDPLGPEESSKKQLAELRMILGAAKEELKQACLDAVQSQEDYMATLAETHIELSRWKDEVPKPPKAEGKCFFPEEHSARVADVKKERAEKQFGGDLLAFE